MLHAHVSMLAQRHGTYVLPQTLSVSCLRCLHELQRDLECRSSRPVVSGPACSSRVDPRCSWFLPNAANWTRQKRKDSCYNCQFTINSQHTNPLIVGLLHICRLHHQCSTHPASRLTCSLREYSSRSLPNALVDQHGGWGDTTKAVVNTTAGGRRVTAPHASLHGRRIPTTVV